MATERPMAALDAAMMTGDVLTNPMHVAALLIFTPPPGSDRHYVDDLFRDGLLHLGGVDPRLSKRPHIGAGTFGRWVWQEVDVDLYSHVQRRVLPPESGEAGLWQLVADLHSLPLDRHRPLWMAYLIDGLPDGRFAFYIKLHHTLVDGVEGMQMIADGLTTDPDARDVKPFYSAGVHAPEPRTEAAGGPPNPLSLLSAIASTAGSSIGLARNLIGGGIDYLAAAAEGISPAPLSAPFTRFNDALGFKRAAAGGSWPLPRFRSVTQVAREGIADTVTINDVLTAVVSGALRGWLQDHDELPASSLIGFCPISVRAGDGSAGSGTGNMFGLQQCPLGTDLADPVARLTLVHRAMAWAKDQVARRGSAATVLLATPNLVPTLLLSMLPLTPKWRTGYNVPISNVRGPAQDMYFNGAHLDALYPVSTVFDGFGLNATICSYADTVSFGYVAGRNLVPDVDTLIGHTEAALTELETALGR
ncbi:MAG: wax ester/triacylglycerol synthase family O-acyltransferase [Mycobacterium sp.]|nr:wax ester/triacylglycerol synthase family O-acyltransferase [Mycobacterium sp.]